MHRMPVLTALAAVLASFLIVDCLEAQIPRRFGTITCQATIDEIPRHPLGLTNQIGTIQLSCTNDGRTPPGAEREFRTHVMVDLMVSLNANIANRIDFGQGEDVTDAVLAFGGDEDPAGADAALGSSVDARFPRPQYGRLVMSNGKMTQSAKRLGLEPVQGTDMDTILFFGDVPFPVPFARNGDYPRCMSFRADDPNGCMPSTIDVVIRNLIASPKTATRKDLLGAYLPSLSASSDRLQFRPESLELSQVCRPVPAAVPGPCSGPAPPTGARSCGTFWFFDTSDEANFELCLKVLDDTRVNDRFWVFAAATTDVEYTLTIDDLEIGPRRIFNPNPDGTGGEIDLTTSFRISDAELFGLEQDEDDAEITEEDIRLFYEIFSPTPGALSDATLTVAPAPTSTINMASADAPVPRYLDILGPPPLDIVELIGSCSTVNLFTGEPACGPSIRSITDISFIEGDLVRNGFFSVFLAGAPAETFFADSLPLGQTGPIRIKITQGTTTVEALDVFSDGNQYNGIIPKDAPLGEVDIRLCIGDQVSPPFPAVIVEKKPRLFTLDGFGSGMGVFQKFDEQRVPTVPIFTDGFESGDISAWGTGLGTSPSRSDRNVSPVENFAESNNVEVRVGGVPAEQIFYAGPNPNFPGLDQYNILPSPGTPPGCFVPLDIVVNDCPPSNFVGIPVSPDGGACFDPVNPYLEDSGMWPRDIVDVQLLQAIVTIPTADGNRTQVRVERARAEAGQYNFTNVNLGVHYPSMGTCTAFNGAGLDQDDVFRRPPPVALETGEFRLTRLSLGDTVTFDKSDPGVDTWSLQLDPEEDPFFVFDDNYALQHTGGQEADIAPFDFRFTIGFRFGGGAPPQTQLGGVDAGIPSHSQAWTNQASFGRKTVIGQDLTLEWDGSGIDPAKTAITITGVSLGENQVGGFICTVDPTLGTFTVPGRLTANIPRTRNPNANVPRGGLAIGTIGTKEGRIVIEPLEQDGKRAYIDFQQREVLNTVWDTCAFATCP